MLAVGRVEGVVLAVGSSSRVSSSSSSSSSSSRVSSGRGVGSSR